MDLKLFSPTFGLEDPSFSFSLLSGNNRLFSSGNFMFWVEGNNNCLFTGNKVGLYSTEMNRDVLMPERSKGINISRFIEVNKVPLFSGEYVILFFFFRFFFKLYFPREIK